MPDEQVEEIVAGLSERLEAMTPIPDLKTLMVAMEDFLNEPQRSGDEPMEVRDYRHSAYLVWEPLCRHLMALQAPPRRADIQAIWDVIHPFKLENGVTMGSLFDSGNDKINLCNRIIAALKGKSHDTE